MTANSPSYRQLPASPADDVARGNALLELAAVANCIPSDDEGLVAFNSLLALWAKRLRGFTPAQVQAGCDAAALDWQYRGMPPLGFIVERIRRASGQDGSQDAALEAEAEAAWSLLRRRLKACGPYFDPQLDPHSKWAIEAFGGWRRLCLASSREIDFMSRDFKARYILHRKTPAVEQGPQAVDACFRALGGGALAIGDGSDVVQ